MQGNRSNDLRNIAPPVHVLLAIGRQVQTRCLKSVASTAAGRNLTSKLFMYVHVYLHVQRSEDGIWYMHKPVHTPEQCILQHL